MRSRSLAPRTLVLPAVVALGTLLAPAAAPAAGVDLGGQLGFSGGAGGEVMLRLDRAAPDLPLDLRLGVAYVARDAGHPEDARRVFINDATNGTPEESGRVWITRFDLLHPVAASWLPGKGWHAYGGVRYARHTSNFNFVGGNENFDVTSHQWGYGAGLEGRFPVGARTMLLLGAGLDHFLSATLSGHDTSYSPDGDTVNGRNDYGWDDADAAVSQPKLSPRVMIGLTRHLGR